MLQKYHDLLSEYGYFYSIVIFEANDIDILKTRYIYTQEIFF